MLGVTLSQAPAHEALNFSVPAHILATLNVVVNGTLHLSHQLHALPSSFATGCQTRSRRYTLSPGAFLLTLLCRADALTDLSQQPAQHWTNTWVPSERLFSAWPTALAQYPQSSDARGLAHAMLNCVAPAYLPPLACADEALALPAQRLHVALHALIDHPCAIVAAQLQLSERGLQRLFLSQLGVSPKCVQRMLRIQRAVQCWDAQPSTLADLAAQVGLVDQAHLAREFRQLVGYPPSSLKRSPTPASPARATDTLWALRTGTMLLPLLMEALPASVFSKT